MKGEFSMFDVTFEYSDRNVILCKNICRVEVSNGNEYRSITGDELLNCHMKHGSTIYLYSDSANHSVSTNGLLRISIEKE